jgi:NAD(P)-dependent dehydrogenase (short-subunit alcohol dehydrogenase family)
MAECEALGGAALAIAADVTDAVAIDEVARRTVARLGRIDVWVNCAAVLHFGRVEETPVEIIDQVLRTNIGGYFNGARAAIRQFRRQGRGTLINVSSVLAITSQPYSSAYVASKAAIRAMGDSLRQEVADAPGIKVCTVLPYAIDTPIYQRAANYAGHAAQPVFPRYSADTVAKAIVDLSRRPRREVYAGRIGHLAELQKAVAPAVNDLVVRLAAGSIELTGPPIPPTPGNVLAPIDDRWRVSGGWKSGVTRRQELALGVAAAGATMAAWVLVRALRQANRRWT